MQGSIRKLSSLACALAGGLVLAATAAGANGPVPWEGGIEVFSEFETKASTAMSELARRQVWSVCASPDEWTQIASVQQFDPNEVWGLTPFDEAGPLDFAVISPQACLAASEWTYATDRRAQKWCVTGQKTEYRTETVTTRRTEYRSRVKTVVKRKKVKGVWKRVRVRVRVRVAVKVPYTESRQVPHQVPVESICGDYVVPKLFSWQTLVHEGVHLAGETNEAATDCYAMQNLPWFASRMGIDDAQAREIGADYWSLYYVPYRPLTPEYHSAECRDGGALDLRPDSNEWPLLRLPARVDLSGRVERLLERPVRLHTTVL